MLHVLCDLLSSLKQFPENKSVLFWGSFAVHSNIEFPVPPLAWQIFSVSVCVCLCVCLCFPDKKIPSRLFVLLPRVRSACSGAKSTLTLSILECHFRSLVHLPAATAAAAKGQQNFSTFAHLLPDHTGRSIGRPLAAEHSPRDSQNKSDQMWTHGKRK